LDTTKKVFPGILKHEKLIHECLEQVNLAISLLEEAFHRTRQINHGKVSAWLLSQFQQ
jgi:hypothetical protein